MPWSPQHRAEAIVLARALGLDVRRARTLRVGRRLVLRLLPCDVVARVAPASEWADLAREAAVAAHIVAHGGPSRAPLGERAGPHTGRTVALTLWEYVTAVGAAVADAEAGVAYAALRPSLDALDRSAPALAAALPDYRRAIRAAHANAKRAADAATVPGAALPASGARLVAGLLAAYLARPTARGARAVPLHGDAHAGNLVCTTAGLRWLDFEAACRGPVEWDLSAPPPAAASHVAHDPGLLAGMRRLRHACVVAWCAAKAQPTPEDREAVAVHLEALLDARAAAG